MSNLSARLFNLQRVLGVRQKAKIAEMLGCSRTMLYNYEQGDPPPPNELLSTLSRLEREAGIEQPFSSVVQDQTNSYGAKTPTLDSHARMIRVIGWAHAGEAEGYEQIPDSWAQSVPTECQDPDAFAVQLEGDSMEPKFSDGDVLVVQPNAQPYSGCFVVARFVDDGVIFRRMEMAGLQIVLKPLNDRWPVTSHELKEFSWIYPVWGRWTQIWKR